MVTDLSWMGLGGRDSWPFREVFLPSFFFGTYWTSLVSESVVDVLRRTKILKKVKFFTCQGLQGWVNTLDQLLRRLTLPVGPSCLKGGENLCNLYTTKRLNVAQECKKNKKKWTYLQTPYYTFHSKDAIKVHE